MALPFSYILGCGYLGKNLRKLLFYPKIFWIKKLLYGPFLLKSC